MGEALIVPVLAAEAAALVAVWKVVR